MFGMNRKIAAAMTILVAAVMAYGQAEAQMFCDYQLENSSGGMGTATVTIDGTDLQIDVVGGEPGRMFTVWIDFRSRATLEKSPDYDALIPKGAESRGVAPAFATTEGVTSGMGLDENAFVIDEFGEAEFEADLDFNILEAGDSPVVGDHLAMQGANRVGGGWLRVYPVDPVIGASLQVTDPETGLPMLERATAQGITIVGHHDMISHGHTPGVGGVDHFGAYKGDFPDSCLY